MFVVVMVEDENVAEYMAHHYLDWFPVGTKILRGDYLLEVMGGGRHHALTTIGMAFDYRVHKTFRSPAEGTNPYNNETYISSNYEWPSARYADRISDWDWSRTYDLRAEDIRAALAREDARQWTRRDLGKFTHECRAPELDDDFESPDLSTLFGDVMPKE